MKERTYQLVVEGISITVTKKRMKNMYLRVKEDGSVCISAPHQVSDVRIREFAQGRVEWIRRMQEKYSGLKEKKAPEEKPGAGEIKRRKLILEHEVWKLVKKWEPIMQVTVSGITIRQMKTRWGSCNVKSHHINISLALLEKEPECLEYVVIHEMCHLLEASHSPEFWKHVAKYCPEWKRIRKKLNGSYIN